MKMYPRQGYYSINSLLQMRLDYVRNCIGAAADLQQIDTIELPQKCVHTHSTVFLGRPELAANLAVWWGGIPADWKRGPTVKCRGLTRRGARDLRHRPVIDYLPTERLPRNASDASLSALPSMTRHQIEDNQKSKA